MPSPSSRPSARDIALARLDRAHLPHLKPNLLSSGSQLANLDPEDAAGFVEALYVGVVKDLLPLRYRIIHHSGRPWRALDPLVQKILLLAAHQLTGMDKVPAAIAVDQAVEQCRRFGRRHAAPLVNAVLRNFGRQPPPSIPNDDPELTYSVPLDLWKRLVTLLGPPAAAEFCRHANSTPELTLRLSPGVKPETLTHSLPDSNVTLTPHEQTGILVAHNARKPLLAQWALQGLAQPQDPTAALVAQLADVSPGMSILDRCAGVGTKSVQLADLTGTAGRVDAIDIDPRRCETLRSFAHQRSLSHLHVLQAGRTSDIQSHLLPDGYHRVLTDVPCSNSGVLARRPEARYHQSKRDLDSLRKLQDDILSDAANLVRPGGLLIYSTCSIWHEENAQTVQRFLQHDTRFVLQLQRETLPAQGVSPNNPAISRYRDGGYVAVMLRY